MSGQSEDHTTVCLPLISLGALVTAVRVCEERKEKGGGEEGEGGRGGGRRGKGRREERYFEVAKESNN